MDELYTGEIILFAGNFVPQNMALCNGQLLSIAENAPLYSLLKTTYGGNGTTDFALPDLRGRVPIQQGIGKGGLSKVTLGQQGGLENTTLTTQQLPSHSHLATGVLKASSLAATTDDPTSAYPAKSNYVIDRSNTANINSYVMGSDITMGNDGVEITVQDTGNNQPFSNMQPFLGLNYIICLYGIYPNRS